MLYVCLTFDYELFLGKNFLSADEILFHPTDKIIRILQSTQTRGTFFADVCSVLQHNRYHNNSYSKKFADQIQKMVKLKQDVQLHIHSNWLLSSPVGEEDDFDWNISSKGYRIHDFDMNPAYHETMESIIKEGKAYLQNTLGEICAEYQCIAYRAGGFCIQPEEKLFQILRNNGILIDSSIAPKLKSEYYNFCDVPPFLNWWIDPKLGIGKNSVKTKDCIYEVSIGTIRNNLFRFAKNPISSWHIKGSVERGKCMGDEENNKRNRIVDDLKLLYRRSFGYGILSLDSRGYRILVQDLNWLYKRWRCNQYDAVICVICHPKLASDDTLSNMKSFINEVKKEKDRFRFVTIRDVYDRLVKTSVV